MEARNLRLELPGWSVNDYRISGTDLEFRMLDHHGRPYPDSRSMWRRLTAKEIALHFSLYTVVSKWYQDKVANWQTTESFEESLPKAS